MAEAQITLKLRPAEFDLIRDAIRNNINFEKELRIDNSEPREVRNSKQREFLLTELLGKFE